MFQSLRWNSKLIPSIFVFLFIRGNHVVGQRIFTLYVQNTLLDRSGAHISDIAIKWLSIYLGVNCLFITSMLFASLSDCKGS